MKLVILDRNGVINFDSAQFIKHPEEWKPIPGSLEAIAALNQAGFRVVVAANESGVGRGLFDMATLNAINAKMHKQVALVGGRIEAVFFCAHPATEKCDCRKPRSGLLADIAARYHIDLQGVAVIGDSLRDLEAAAEAGARPILVLSGKGAKTQAAGGLPAGVRVFDDLAGVARALIAEAA